MNENKQEKLCMGIDVSKGTLDIHWLGKSYKIKNDEPSISAFIKAEVRSSFGLLCVMESTGGYESVVAQAFNAHNIAFHIAHPSRVHAFAQACGHFAKTDKLDAIVLHRYAQFISNEEKGDKILDPAHAEIVALRRLSRSLGGQPSCRAMPCWTGTPILHALFRKRDCLL